MERYSNEFMPLIMNYERKDREKKNMKYSNNKTK